ncbi:MAG TPA: PQQ-binding-like beta-propeller repeat protein [Acidimicrobiales bacterium]|nr:PQQ-binding-like beta-propeller repeat protein [Acidimicrobiales bacterium]
MRFARLGGLLAAVALLAGCAGSSGASSDRATASTATAHHAPGPGDWPTYGHDAQHTFHGATTLTEATAKQLKVAWFFPTDDAVTATPTVVDGTVYVGSWDDNFYALDLATGKVRWRQRLSAQNGVTPYPGQHPRDATSDGGLVTSSAWYQTGSGSRPDLVIFGGGYTLYALVASTGALYWRHDYPGRPGAPLDPSKDDTRIFSSPVVVDGKVIFGIDVDGADGQRGYIQAADLTTGKPVWDFQTDVDASGRVANDGCGSVWSSGTVLPAAGLVVFDTSDCGFGDDEPLAEAVIALHVDRGTLAWSYHPHHPDVDCDWDFGASANAGVTPAGDATFLGVGGKDGTYYSLDPTTGRLRWSTNVVFGGFAGGFIATTAYDGLRVYGSTALGDFGRFEKGKTLLCDANDPRDTGMQEPSVHAFEATNGSVAWQMQHAPSFAPTTVAGGMTFNGPALDGNILQIRDTATGALIATVKVPGPIWSGVATVGDAVVTGIGSSYNAQPAGIAVLTPGGSPPDVGGV